MGMSDWMSDVGSFDLMPTPATSTAVLKRYIGSTVEARCVQVPLPLWVRLKRMLATGIRNRAATATDSKAKPLQDRRARGWRRADSASGASARSIDGWLLDT